MHQTAKETLATSGGAVDSRAPGGRPLPPVDGNLFIKESRSKKEKRGVHK